MTAEHFELTALRRVSAGGVTVHDGGYVHDGRPVSGELAAALVRLRAGGCLTVGEPGVGRHRPVQTTVAGALRLDELRACDGLSELDGRGPQPGSSAR